MKTIRIVHENKQKYTTVTVHYIELKPFDMHNAYYVPTHLDATFLTLVTCFSIDFPV